MMSSTFTNTEAWLSALSKGEPAAIMPAGMAAKVLNETSGALSKKLKNGNIPGIKIGKKHYLSADWVHQELTGLLKIIKDARGILERVARQQSKIFYGDLMAELGMTWKNPPDRKKIGYILGELSRDSFQTDNIFLSSVVHRKGPEPTHPGPGYIGLLGNLADEYDDVDFNLNEDEASLIARHMRQVWDHYRES